MKQILIDEEDHIVIKMQRVKDKFLRILEKVRCYRSRLYAYITSKVKKFSTVFKHICKPHKLFSNQL